MQQSFAHRRVTFLLSRSLRGPGHETREQTPSFSIRHCCLILERFTPVQTIDLKIKLTLIFYSFFLSLLSRCLNIGTRNNSILKKLL